jgi:hypothetical protein
MEAVVVRSNAILQKLPESNEEHNYNAQDDRTPEPNIEPRVSRVRDTNLNNATAL